MRIRSVGAGELRAIAGFGSGATRVERDVTSLTRWSTTDRRVARVAEDGAPESNAGAAASLRIVGPGRAHVLARFGNLTARLPVLRPFAEPSARAKAHEPVPSQPNAAARSIDGAWHGGLARLGLVPAPPAGPLRVLRRVALDLVGRPPTLAELRQFEAEAGPRSQRIRRFAERWVASDEFAEVFGRHLAEWFELPDPLFFGERKDGRAAAASAVRQRVVDQLREGATVPAVLRELLRRREHVYRVADPRDRAELFGRTVLGLRIGCARCHDHPEDRWSRDDHQRFAALFAATDSTPEAGMVTSGLFDPTTGARITGRLPDRVASVPLPQRLRSPAGLVEGGVEWLAFEGAVDRLYRNLANRVVRVLFGRGLVEPVDDHRASNPAVDEDLLAVLTGRLAAAEGDLREFLTELVSSEFYATQSGLDAPRRRYLGAREVRALDAHALRRAARRAIGLEFVADRPLPSSPLARELDVLHGDAVFAALQSGDHLVDAIAQFGGSPREQIEDLWRLLLTRPPRVAEVERFLPALQQASDPGGVLRDLAFAILAGREFGSVR